MGAYLLLRIDDPAAGRALVRRLLPLVETGRPSDEPARGAWLTVAFTYHGLQALGVPQASLDSFAPEFRQGMAARAAELGDVGESDPVHWEKPLGTPDVHVALAFLAQDVEHLERVRERARRAHEDLPGVEVIWRQECYQLPTGRTSFGFKDGIGQPAVEGSGRPPTNSHERPLKAGEIILGYPDETGELPPMPTPDVLGRNGTYVVFRKLHTRVAAYRQYLREKAASREDEALLGAKMVGRWQSGAPLARGAGARRSGARRRPASGTTTSRYGDDLRGFKCPAGAHARRANPRDALDLEGSVNARLHRMIRRGTSYGPMLPDGVLEDDGADRGIVFVFAGAHIRRQFEFVKTQWLNDGIFIGAPAERDPLVGPNDGDGQLHRPAAADPPAADGPAAVRRHPRRRVLLRARPPRPALARRAGHVTQRREHDVATPPMRTDRWQAMDFAPPAADAAEPEHSVTVEYESDGRVAIVTLNRPHADNAITTEMGDRLTEIVETIAVRTAVRVVILTGAGDRAFSVGSDLRQRKNMTKEDWLRQRQNFDRTLYTVRQLRKPIFAAVNGIAYGGGSELAQSADFIIASETATFGQPEAMIGLAAGGGSPVFLPRLPAAGQGAADADDRRADHRAGGVPARHGQRAPRARRADGRRAAHRRHHRQQLADRGAGREAGRAHGRGPADRAGHRDHDGGALALRRPPGSQRGHHGVQRGPRPDLPGRGLLTDGASPSSTRRPDMAVADDLERARAALTMIHGAPFNAEAPPAALQSEITPTELHYVRSNFAVPTHDGGSRSAERSRRR